MSITNCKSESPQEALDRFEKAVRKQEQFKSDILHNGESAFSYVETNNAVKAAKTEVLIWMSYIP